jgi:hypothetical protein
MEAWLSSQALVLLLAQVTRVSCGKAAAFEERGCILLNADPSILTLAGIAWRSRNCAEVTSPPRGAMGRYTFKNWVETVRPPIRRRKATVKF